MKTKRGNAHGAKRVYLLALVHACVRSLLTITIDSVSRHSKRTQAAYVRCQRHVPLPPPLGNYLTYRTNGTCAQGRPNLSRIRTPIQPTTNSNELYDMYLTSVHNTCRVDHGWIHLKRPIFIFHFVSHIYLCLHPECHAFCSFPFVSSLDLVPQPREPSAFCVFPSLSNTTIIRAIV